MAENNHNTFTEEELLEKIAGEAEKDTVPDSLKPENMKKSLKARQRARRRRYYRNFAAAAAAVAVFVGGAGAVQLSRNAFVENRGSAGQASSADIPGETGSATEAGVVPAKNASVGDDYHLAEDYEEIYELYQSAMASKYGAGIKDAIGDAAVTGIVSSIYNDLFDESNYAAAAPGMADGADGSGTAASAGNDDIETGNAVATSAESGYSKTNIMEEGVDESDIVKTDGNYIYSCKDKKVSIVDITGSKMKVVAAVKPELGNVGRIRELYVDGDRLYIIGIKDDDPLYKGVLDGDDDVVFDSNYYSNMDGDVLLLTYDITDRAQPELIGSIEQEGSYNTSRKVGDYIYLFTNRYLFDGEDKENLIPKINGVKVEADCIYLPAAMGNQELVVSSMNVSRPDESMDQLVVLNDYDQVYMSTESIYLYGWAWDRAVATAENSGVGIEAKLENKTRIAKFSYKDGVLNGEESVAVKGSIEDAFAIHESDGCLQVLTTDWDEVSKNQLYLFDEKLELMGSLEGIAAGEEIYAARCIGSIMYFITYHNTDPLFAVDISDPSNPEMLGHVKITGFSDYLHPYGENLLLGIGYETDPETSRTLGVKLTMFDISDPAELKILDTFVIKDAYSTGATFDYKALLADPERNLIGFETKYWEDLYAENGSWLENEEKHDYHLYQWKDGKFAELFNQVLPGSPDYMSETRGLYSGDSFYLAIKGGIGDKYRVLSYDMADEFKAIDELEY